MAFRSASGLGGGPKTNTSRSDTDSRSCAVALSTINMSALAFLQGRYASRCSAGQASRSGGHEERPGQKTLVDGGKDRLPVRLLIVEGFSPLKCSKLLLKFPREPKPSFGGDEELGRDVPLLDLHEASGPEKRWLVSA